MVDFEKNRPCTDECVTVGAEGRMKILIVQCVCFYKVMKYVAKKWVEKFAMSEKSCTFAPDFDSEIA